MRSDRAVCAFSCCARAEGSLDHDDVPFIRRENDDQAVHALRQGPPALEEDLEIDPRVNGRSGLFELGPHDVGGPANREVDHVVVEEHAEEDGNNLCFF